MNSFRSLVRYSLRVLILGFFLSSLTWVPQVYHFFIIFFSVSLPKIISMAVAPKSLFIVSNLIVIFLFGESKLGKCTENDEYDCMTGNEKVEYFGVERKMLTYEISKETDVGIIQENKDVEVVVPVDVEEKYIVDIVDKREEIMAQEDGEEGKRECEEMEMREDEEEIESENEELEREDEEMEMREDERDIESENEELEREEEEMEEWPAEEFNKKVEDFIAKFNMQIRLEARMAISCY